MAREFFKNLPDTTTPLNAQRMNAFLNGEEAMGSIVVDDIECKNLLNPAKQTVTINGVSFTTNKDGSITLNGTATENIAYIFSTQKIDGNGGNYYLGITTDYSSIGYGFEVAGYIYNTNNEVAKIISPNRGTQIIETNEYVSNFNIYFQKGAAFNNFTIYPQLEKNDKPSPYTPYKNFEGRTDIITGQECPTNEYEDDERIYCYKYSLTSTTILNEEVEVADLPANVKRIKDIKGMFYFGSYQTPLLSGANGFAFVEGNKLKMVISNAAYNGKPLELKLYYTKN